MTVPAREPFRVVPRGDDPGPAAERRASLLIWGAYPAMRAGIRALLAEMGIEATEAADASEFAEHSVVIADAGDQPVADVLREVREQFGAGASIIVLAGEAAQFESIATGPEMPAGMLLRDVSAQELAAAVQGVASGLTVLDPEVAVAFPSARRAPSNAEPLDEPLTERELEVLRELASGLPNKAIALRLGISEHTVKYHVGEILGKLAAASRTEAVMLAARRGLLPL